MHLKQLHQSTFPKCSMKLACSRTLVSDSSEVLSSSLNPQQLSVQTGTIQFQRLKYFLPLSTICLLESVTLQVQKPQYIMAHVFHNFAVL